MGVYLLTVYLLKDEQLVEDRRYSRFAIKAAGLAAACSFSATPRLWLQSNHDKPYPLLAFMTAIIFYLLLKWRDHYKDGSERPAYVMSVRFWRVWPWACTRRSYCFCRPGFC